MAPESWRYDYDQLRQECGDLHWYSREWLLGLVIVFTVFPILKMLIRLRERP